MSSNSIAQITQKVKQKEAQKARLEQLERMKLSDFVTDSDLEEIEKEIQNLKNNLNLKMEKTLNQLDSMLDIYDLDVQKIEETQFQYLFDKFLVKGEITMFAAPPGSGKSLISVALCNMFLSDRSVRQVIYFDGDNGSATIKERNIHVLKQKWGRKLRYFHESSASRAQMFQIIKQLQRTDLSDVFIVFDSIKNFMQGSNRDRNKDVSKVMEILQSLRARGATILFLHHTNKPQRDLQELTYAGSSAFQEDTGNAYILQKNNFKHTFVFKNFKARTGELKDMAFRYNDDHTLTEIDFLEASETEEIAEINEVIVDFIEKQSQKPSYSQIMQHLQKAGYARNKSNQAIQSGKNRYWKEEKLTQNNRSVYYLIPQQHNVVEVEYRDFDNNLQKTEQIIKNTRTSDTSCTSPILVVSDTCSTSIQPVQVRTSHINMPVL